MRSVGRVMLLAVLAIPPVRVSADEPPAASHSSNADPAVRLAGDAARVVERDKAAWRELTERLAKAVEAYNIGLSPDPLPEDEALQAFRSYCGNLLQSGQYVAALHARWADARAALADSLRKSPPYYRAAAQALPEKTGVARFPAVGEKYLLAADVWDQLAVRAEARARELVPDGGAGDVAALVAEENRFLEDLLGTLDALPRPAGELRGHLASAAGEAVAAVLRPLLEDPELPYRSAVRAYPEWHEPSRRKVDENRWDEVPEDYDSPEPAVAAERPTARWRPALAAALHALAW